MRVPIAVCFRKKKVKKIFKHSSIYKDAVRTTSFTNISHSKRFKECFESGNNKEKIFKRLLSDPEI